MINSDALPLASYDPCRLFDPSETAQDLVDVSQLRTAARELQPLMETRPPIELHEASLSERRLLCRCTMPADQLTSGELWAVLTSSDGGESRISLTSTGQACVGDVDDAVDRRCAEGTTLIHVEATVEDAPPCVSNRLFLINLKDIESGRGQCREGRIREAQRSAMQFAAVLNELLALGDPDALTVFLTHCDIPLINAVRPYVFQRLHPHWEGTDVWRTLSDRDLRAYAFPARRRARLL